MTPASPSLSGLPAELRVRIFGYAVPADKLLTVKLHFQSKTRLYTGASLLLVDKRTHKEALPLFYESNTFSISQEAFTTGVTLGRKLETYPNSQHLTYLHLSDLASLPDCSSQPACATHRTSALNLLESILQIPRLRSLSVDYGNGNRMQTTHDLQSFALLKRALKSTTNYILKCVGVGSYTLQDFTRPKLDITFQDRALIRVWEESTPEHIKHIYDLAVSDCDDAKIMAGRSYSDYHLTLRSVGLFLPHDSSIYSPATPGCIPSEFLAIWPQEIRVDLRRLGEPETLAFLEEMDEYLRYWFGAIESPSQMAYRW